MQLNSIEPHVYDLDKGEITDLDKFAPCSIKLMQLKACVHYFHQIFIFSPNDSSLKTMKNAFYFI